MNSTIGKHIIVELGHCPSHFLDNPDVLDRVFSEGIKRCGATIIGRVLHKFQPQGVSGIYLLSESHTSFHTWPEKGYASIDTYTCGNCDPMKILVYIASWVEDNYKVKPKLYMTELTRGMEDEKHFFHEAKERF